MSSVIFIATIGVSADQGVLIHNGFLTGQNYIKMSELQKRAYVMGAIDGILICPLFGAPKEKLRWFEAYVENMTDEQVVAILSKYLEDNPGIWHDSLHTHIYNAIKQAYDKSRITDK
jgi:uncharacterized membrane protein YciS (DUF1049 family)